MIISGAPNCGITYDCHYDNRNSFIMQATDGSMGSQFLLSEKSLKMLIIQEVLKLVKNKYKLGMSRICKKMVHVK